MIAAAFDEAEARDPQHLRTWVILVDGAEHQLNLIRAETALRGVTIQTIIDIIYVLDYIWVSVWSLRKAGDPAAEDSVAAKALAVLADDSDRAAQEITSEADSRRAGRKPAPGPPRIRYLNGKREFLRYDKPWKPAGRSRPGSLRAPADIS